MSSKFGVQIDLDISKPVPSLKPNPEVEAAILKKNVNMERHHILQL